MSATDLPPVGRSRRTIILKLNVVYLNGIRNGNFLCARLFVEPTVHLEHFDYAHMRTTHVPCRRIADSGK